MHVKFEISRIIYSSRFLLANLNPGKKLMAKRQNLSESCIS